MQMSTLTSSAPQSESRRPRAKSVTPKGASREQNPKRKVRSNPSSPRSTPTNQSPISIPVTKSLLGSPVVLGKERELVPYFPEGDPEGHRNLCQLGGGARSITRITATKRTSIHSPSSSFKPTSASPTSPTKTMTTAKTQSPGANSPRHQYAGAAFEQSPSPDALPRPSFLDDEDEANLAAASSSPSPSNSSTSSVSRELVFDDLSSTTHFDSPTSSHSRVFSFAEFSHAFAATNNLAFAPSETFSHAHHQHDVLAGSTAHLKRLLNIAVA